MSVMVRRAGGQSGAQLRAKYAAVPLMPELAGVAAELWRDLAAAIEQTRPEGEPRQFGAS